MLKPLSAATAATAPPTSCFTAHRSTPPPATAPALCFGSSEAALADIEARAAEILHDGKLPLLLGGEHLVTLGAVRAVAEKYPGLHIIHFDAHADLRDDYLGAKLSHACVLRRCHEIVGDGRIHQFCIRSGERAEFEFAAQHTGVSTATACKVLRELLIALDKGWPGFQV